MLWQETTFVKDPSSSVERKKRMYTLCSGEKVRSCPDWIRWHLSHLAWSTHSLRREIDLGYQHLSLARVWKWKWSNDVEKSKMDLFWCISMPNNVKSCKKIDEKAQTAKFTVFARGSELRGAKNMENLENWNVSYSNISNVRHPGYHHVKQTLTRILDLENSREN